MNEHHKPSATDLSWWRTATHHTPTEGPIAGVRLKLSDQRDSKVRAYATLELTGGYIVQDVRLVETQVGRLVVAMPFRKLGDHCPHCRHRTPFESSFCGACGARLADPHLRAAQFGLPPKTNRSAYVHDTFFPSDPVARKWIESAVLAAYETALAESRTKAQVGGAL